MKNRDSELIVKVFKFDPAVDALPRYETHRIPPMEGTLLDVLNYIRLNRDPGLSFRSGCCKGACGACPVILNGRPVFACQKSVEPEMSIAPHPKFEIIKDLVVDLDRPRGTGSV